MWLSTILCLDAIALRNFQFHKRTLPTLPLSPQPRPPCAHMTHHGTLEGICPVVLQQPKRKTHREKKRKKKRRGPVRDRSIQQMMVCFFDRFVDWLSCNPHTPSCDPVTISPVGRVATATAWAPLKKNMEPRSGHVNRESTDLGMLQSAWPSKMDHCNFQQQRRW